MTAIENTVTSRQCEGRVRVHRSTGSLRRDAELGLNDMRQCRARATYRFAGKLGGKPRVENLCYRHASPELSAGACSGWIDSIDRIAPARVNFHG